MTKQEQIAEKVKKLLRLSESDNVHEAQIALDKANDLIAEHAIREAQLKTGDPDVKLQMIKTDFPLGGKPWERILCAVVAKTYGCSMLQHRSVVEKKFKLELFGLPQDVEICKSMINFATDTIKNLKAKEKGKVKKKIASYIGTQDDGYLDVNGKWVHGYIHFNLGGSVKNYLHNYVVGIADGMRHTLQEIQRRNDSQEYGLILRDKEERVDEFMKEELGFEPKKINVGSRCGKQGYSAGNQVGRSVNFSGEKDQALVG